MNAVTIFCLILQNTILLIATSTRKSDKITFLHHLFAEGVIKVAMSVFHVRKYDQGSTISGRVLQGFAVVLQPFEFINTDGRIM